MNNSLTRGLMVWGLSLVQGPCFKDTSKAQAKNFMNYQYQCYTFDFLALAIGSCFF